MCNILVVAPHPDDEILGVGGTIIKNVHNGNKVYVCFVCRGKEPLFRDADVQISRAETKRCHEMIGIEKSFYLDFPAVMLEKENRYEINAKLLEVIQQTHPDEVYLPHYGDMQRDHQIVADAAMVCLRPKYEHRVKRIYGYETLSETEWNTPSIQNAFIPNVYVDISGFLSRKLDALRCYDSQLSDFPNTRSAGAVEALARYRGSLMHVEAAEAFMLIRDIR